MDSNVSPQDSTAPETPFSPAGYFDRTSKQYSHPFSQQRQYRVFIPPTAGESPMPLVMVLHGCEQNHLDMQAISHFDSVAEEHGFAVVYPFVTKYPDFRNIHCWGWWRDEQITANSGEVEDLWKIAEEVIDEFNIDQHSVHITGLSAGGAMAVAALIVHGNRFASGAAVAGLAYGETIYAIQNLFGAFPTYQSVDATVAKMKTNSRDSADLPPLCIVHSQGDNIVNIQAGINLRDSWLQFLTPEKLTVRSTEEHKQDESHWSHTSYSVKESEAFVETIFFEKLRHGWYGGGAGNYSFPDAPSISSLMWTFFKKHTTKQTDTITHESISDENTQQDTAEPIVHAATADTVERPHISTEDSHVETLSQINQLTETGVENSEIEETVDEAIDNEEIAVEEKVDEAIDNEEIAVEETVDEAIDNKEIAVEETVDEAIDIEEIAVEEIVNEAIDTEKTVAVEIVNKGTDIEETATEKASGEALLEKDDIHQQPVESFGSYLHEKTDADTDKLTNQESLVNESAMENIEEGDLNNKDDLTQETVNVAAANNTKPHAKSRAEHIINYIKSILLFKK